MGISASHFYRGGQTSLGVLNMPAAQSVDGFKSKAIFDGIEASLKEDGKTLVGKVKGIYGFKVKGGPGGSEGFWIVDAKNGNGSVEFNGKGCQIKLLGVKTICIIFSKT